MSFQEIDSVIDIKSDHRLIMYYIECKSNETDFNASKLHKSLEAVMRTLVKKNDDVLLVKVARDSEMFTKFEQLYKPDIKGEVTLFIVNNEGIPFVCQHIFDERDISVVISSICSVCALHPIPAIDLDVKLESNLSCTINTDKFHTNKESKSPSKTAEPNSNIILRSIDRNKLNKPTDNSVSESLSQNDSPDSQLSRTELQIRLPDGSRHKQQFDKEAMLNEVWVYISTQYKLKDFDLKTYNHHNFSEEEYQNTLKDLGLYPNGVVIVVPKLGVSINKNGWIEAMFRNGLYQVMSKTTNIYCYIQGLFIMVWNSLFFSNGRPPGDVNQGRKQIQSSQKSNSDQSSSQRRSKTATTSFGNVHTLRRNDDSDDENNRYNGNSTQQK